MSIAQRNEIEALKKRMQIIEDAYAVIIANQAKVQTPVQGQCHQDQVEVKVPPEIARETLTLPEKRKSA